MTKSLASNNSSPQSSTQASKATLRAQLQKKLASLPLYEKDIASRAICDEILSSAEYQSAKVILAYLALKSEVNIDQLIKTALAQGKVVAVPRVLSKTEMEFRSLDGTLPLQSELSIGAFSIREPKATLPLVTFERDGVVIENFSPCEKAIDSATLQIFSNPKSLAIGAKTLASAPKPFANNVKPSVSNIKTLENSIKYSAESMEVLARDVKTLESREETFVSTIKPFANNAKPLASNIKTFENSEETFVSGEEAFASGEEAFVSGETTVESGEVIFESSPQLLKDGPKPLVSENKIEELESAKNLESIEKLEDELIKPSFLARDTGILIKKSAVLALIPGVAFTKSGARLGRGGGYYDRFLPLISGAVLWGVGFACQELESLPVEIHDVALSRVIFA